MKTLEQAILDKILYIGEEIPKAVAEDKRPKFVLLGTPQELIDEVVGEKGETIKGFEEEDSASETIFGDKKLKEHSKQELMEIVETFIKVDSYK